MQSTDSLFMPLSNEDIVGDEQRAVVPVGFHSIGQLFVFQGLDVHGRNYTRFSPGKPPLTPRHNL